MKHLLELLNMSYKEVVEYLLDKYGVITKNYFTKSGNPTPSIKRGKEGLYIHHIDEDKMILLSNKIGNHPVILGGYANESQKYEIENTFQKSDRLVYCDLLEHLILHFKIMQYPEPMIDIVEVGVGGALNFIIPELNDIYSGIKYMVPWKLAVINRIIDKREEYLDILKWGVDKLGINPEKYKSTLSYNQGIWNIKKNKKIFDDINNKMKA